MQLKGADVPKKKEHSATAKLNDPPEMPELPDTMSELAKAMKDVKKLTEGVEEADTLRAALSQLKGMTNKEHRKQCEAIEPDWALAKKIGEHALAWKLFPEAAKLDQLNLMGLSPDYAKMAWEVLPMPVKQRVADEILDMPLVQNETAANWQLTSKEEWDRMSPDRQRAAASWGVESKKCEGK
jgi:Sec-independent protein translocase protein TatA